MNKRPDPLAYDGPNADRASCAEGSIWELDVQPNGEIIGRYQLAPDVT